MELLTPSQLRELESVFKTYDTSGEGLIDAKELGVMLRAMGMHCTEAEVQDIIVIVDSDGSGKLDFPEFVNLMISRYVFLFAKGNIRNCAVKRAALQAERCGHRSRGERCFSAP